MTTYGIDLGTTYSCIAYVDEFGKPVVIKTREGEDTLPSVVWFSSPDNVVVGRTAKSSALLEPDSVISLVKRQMGTDVEWEFHGKQHTPETISALILRELAQAAEEECGVPVNDVVVTVPAYFGIAEREATRNAGTIAGLNVLNLVPEPVAAALHYDALSDGGDRTILVYDLGGGTFDTTVIRLCGNDIQVVCTDGDHHLGGADWDARIVDHLIEQLLEARPEGEDPGADESFRQELANAAEQLKKDLTRAESRPYTMRVSGQPVKVELSRATFEELTSELLDRTLDITGRTIETAKTLGVDHFDDVLLVGGASRMPAVAQKLAERFGFSARLKDPDLAVAKGAALSALIESVKSMAFEDTALEEIADQTSLSKEQVKQLVDKKVTYVVPRSFGIRIIDSNDPKLERECIAHLLPANTPLPAAPRTEMFGTVAPNQTAVKIEVWEQAGEVASAELYDNAKIAEGVMTGLPPLPAGSPIEVRIGMDEHGRLTVDAKEMSTGTKLRVEATVEGLSAEEVKAARDAIGRYTMDG
jgi:molecular chaperone DnaK (HSP70)